MIESGIFNDLVTKIKDFPLVVLNEDSNYGIGIYEGGFLYIGEYVDMLRSGYALWVNDFGHRYEGEWSNDLPNGDGIIYANNNERWTITGVVANGRWNGSVTEVHSNDLTIIVEYINGKVITTGEPHESHHSDGVIIWPVTYEKDHFWPLEYISGLHGVFPFADYY